MTVSVARHWNTWDASRPAAMVHLPTGLTVRLSAYSAKSGRFDSLLAGTHVELHEHTVDGDYVRVRARVSGSLVEIEFATSAAETMVGSVRLLDAGEWSLRFWLYLEIGFTDVRHGPPTVPERPASVEVEVPDDPYNQPPSVITRHRSTWHCVVTDVRPVSVGTYDEIEQLGTELEAHGYYAPHEDCADPSWAVLRFNGQANAEFAFAAGAGHDRAAAAWRAREALGAADALTASRRAEADRGTEAWRAVRDVVAWNTIWDVPNGRPMTVLTRNWLSGKFGGWGVWLDDVLFHALLAGYAGDWETARANLAAALTPPAPDGNLPCLRTAYEEWVDRSQPPIAGYVLWRLYALSGDRTLLSTFLPPVVRAHDWWFEARDGNGDGLLEFGSSPTGTGAFVHTKQAALDEAAMDNLPAFDEAEFDPVAHTLDLAEPALNSLLALEGRALEDLLGQVGRRDDARRIGQRGRELTKRIRTGLWDERRGVFAGRRWDGTFVESLAPTSFYPWLCGAADDAQTERMIGVLRDETKFWGDRVLPASTFDDPASADLVYWRGRIWPPLVFWVWEGLRSAEQDDAAADVAERAWQMFLEGWQERRCYENFHPDDGAQDASPDSDPFYGWGALIPLMVVMAEAEAHPQRGRVFAPGEGSEVALHEPGRMWTARRDDDEVSIAVNGRPYLRVSGTASCVEVAVAGPRLRVTARAGRDVRVLVHGLRSDEIVGTTVDGQSVDGKETDQGWVVQLPPDAVTVELVVCREGALPTC